MKILILGGYGVFGGWLVELLADQRDLELLICGRSQTRATAFCNAFSGIANVRPLQLDRRDIEQALANEKPDIVVDASGPFQNYNTGGGQGYKVIEACLRSKTHYMDFADGSDFVFGVTRYDQQARDAGLFVLSGVSTFPILTAAVLRKMAQTMDIVSVTGGIAPSPYAGIGINVMRAVVGYAGEPVTLLRDGVQEQAPGLAESLRYTIGVPGHMPLRNIHFSLVDVPDLQVVPPEHDGMRDIWMGAGPVPEFLHRVLNLLAKARAALPLPSLLPLAGLFYAVLNRMKFGEHRGGMFIHAHGLRDGIAVEQSWHLLAEGDDGPLIPSMAIAALIGRAQAGQMPEPGARPATRALELSDYKHQFDGRTIFTGFRRTTSPLLYRRVLDFAFEKLPPSVQSFHGSGKSRRWRGTAEVSRGKSMIARLVSAIMRFPESGSDVPVEVTVEPSGKGERWTRNFNGRCFSSLQTPGQGRNAHLIQERFGPITVALALVIEADRLYLVARRWSCLGLPLPGFLLPSGRSFETETAGRFCFDVEIALPLIGLIVAYRGQLQPDQEAVQEKD